MINHANIKQIALCITSHMIEKQRGRSGHIFLYILKKFVALYTMKALRGRGDISSYSFVTAPLGGGEWLASLIYII